MSTNPKFDANALAKAIQEAPEAGQVKLQFGRLSVAPVVSHWIDDPDRPGKRKNVRRLMQPGEEIKRGETLELRVTVDIQEMNPDLDFTYERHVQVKRSSDREKSDFTEIVERAFIQVFGKKWLELVAKEPYVCLEDAPNYAGRANDKGKVFGVPKVIRFYKSKADCYAAWEAVYGGREGDEVDDSEIGEEIPESVLEQVRQLMVAMAGDVNAALGMLAGKPFGDYEPRALLKAIGVELTD